MKQGKNGSLIELAAAADSADALHRAVDLLSLALKGALDGAGTAFQVSAHIASDCSIVTAVAS